MMDRDKILEKPVVQKYLSQIVGPEGMQVAMSPPDGEFTDEELAEKIDMDVNTVRRVLIILNEHNLSEYRRVRDKSSGWLTYYWVIKYENIPGQLKQEMETLLEKLKQRYEFEENSQFYTCSTCFYRYEFNEAMEMDFTCPQCGSKDMEAQNFDEIMELMKKRIDEIEEELKETESNL